MSASLENLINELRDVDERIESEGEKQHLLDRRQELQALLEQGRGVLVDSSKILKG
jgi:hypothetical protein